MEQTPPRPVRVLIVDDSAAIRRVLTEILDQDPGIEVVGTAPDPYIARERIKKLDPDVITLDIEMPRMDGITFLRNLMRLRPMPVVMISALTEAGADATLEALALGAVDYVTKPGADAAGNMDQYAEEIVAKVKAAATARVEGQRRLEVPPRLSADAVIARRPPPRDRAEGVSVIAIGASTGGTEAVRQILARLPADMPPIVIAQHLPGAFSAAFARRLDAGSELEVQVAGPGAELEWGRVYVAPGDAHLLVCPQAGRLVAELNQGPRVNRHRPSVDVLFRSVAQAAGASAVGVLLTGMGRDGAEGLGEILQAGGETIAQDEASSVIWGMPGAACELGHARQVLGLEQIPHALEALVAGQRARDLAGR